MRYSFIVVLVAVGCIAPAGEESKDGPSERHASPFPLRGEHVVFYNVENLFDAEDDPRTKDEDFLPTSELQWTPERLETKLEHLAKAVAMGGKNLPTLVGLAEVENRRVVERLAESAGLKAAGYSVVHEDSPDERGIDVALLVDPEVFTIVRHEALNVPLPGDRTRDILHAELEADGHVFHVFVNHWPSRREGPAKSEPKRMAAAKVLRSAVEALPKGPNIHTLIMGDFNDTPKDRSIQEGMGAMCAKNDGHLSALMCMDQPHGHGSYQYNGTWDYLDQFLVSTTLIAEVESAQALWEKQLLFDHPKYGPSPDKTYSGGRYKGGYSDHLPIVLRFK